MRADARKNYEHLLDAFQKVESDVQEFGTVNVHRNPRRTLDVVADFAKAGMPRVSLDILEAISSMAINQYGVDGASMLEAIGKLRGMTDQRSAAEEERLTEALAFLSGRLAELLSATGRT